MTISLEYIAPEDWPGVARNFQALMSLVLDVGTDPKKPRSIGIRFGTATLTFAASTNSSNVTVTHGLGRAPIAIVATSLLAGAFGQIPTCNAHTVGATTFGLNGESKTAFTGSTTVSWIAIG